MIYDKVLVQNCSFKFYIFHFHFFKLKNYYGNASFTAAFNFIEDSTDGDVAQWKALQKSFVRETAQFYRARKNSRGFCPKIQKIVSFSQNKYWL